MWKTLIHSTLLVIGFTNIRSMVFHQFQKQKLGTIDVADSLPYFTEPQFRYIMPSRNYIYRLQSIMHSHLAEW